MPQFFTDFSEYTADAAPSDWTARWGRDAAIVRDSGIPSGSGHSHALELSDTEAVSWDAVGEPSGDTEVAVLFHATSLLGTSTDRARFFMHGSEGSSAEVNGYSLGFQRGSQIGFIQRWIDNSTTTIDSESGPVDQQVWAWFRFRREGNNIRARAWLFGDTEPGTWIWDGSDSTFSSGFIGVERSSSFGSLWVAAVGVGTGGDPAPMETPTAEENLLAGDSIGIGETSGDLQFTRNLTGLSAGIGASTGLLSVDTGLNLFTGASIGAGYSEGALHIARNLAGASVGIGEADGSLSVIDSNIILLSGASVGVGVSSAAVQMDIHLRGVSIGEGSSIHRYLGPGYGIVDSPPPSVIDRAQPGDSFSVHLPWAGLYGMSGLARVLSVQIREGKRTINAQFIPMPDEALIPGLAKGEPIRYAPRIQNDPWKLNRENQRGIRRIDRSQRRR